MERLHIYKKEIRMEHIAEILKRRYPRQMKLIEMSKQLEASKNKSRRGGTQLKMKI